MVLIDDDDGIVPYDLHKIVETEQQEVSKLMNIYVLHAGVHEPVLSTDLCNL